MRLRVDLGYGSHLVNGLLGGLLLLVLYIDDQMFPEAREMGAVGYIVGTPLFILVLLSSVVSIVLSLFNYRRAALVLLGVFLIVVGLVDAIDAIPEWAADGVFYGYVLLAVALSAYWFMIGRRRDRDIRPRSG